MRLYLASVLGGALLSAGAGYGLRGTEARPGIEAAPPQPQERSADVAEGIAYGCGMAGLDVTGGVEDGVYVIRCRKPLPNLGVHLLPPRSARLKATPAPALTPTSRAGVTTPRAVPGVRPEVAP